MKSKKTAQPRRRISFAVDRDEIEINSGWVEAVMTRPAAPASESPVSPAPIPFPAPSKFSESDRADGDGFFFGPDKNIATGEDPATGAECTAVEISSAVDEVTPVEQSNAVEQGSPVENQATVAPLATAEAVRKPPTRPISVENNTTVENRLSVDAFAPISTKDHRTPRPRPIFRITDGLTPGQYAVYSLMYESGEPAEGMARIYKGGYADLGRLSGMSKRGIQNIVAELQAKHVIRLHQQPGYHRTETSSYWVPPADAVVHGWFSKGWRHALGKSKTLAY